MNQTRDPAFPDRHGGSKKTKRNRIKIPDVPVHVDEIPSLPVIHLDASSLTGSYFASALWGGKSRREGGDICRAERRHDWVMIDFDDGRKPHGPRCRRCGYMASVSGRPKYWWRGEDA